MWILGGERDGESLVFSDFWSMNLTSKAWTWVSGRPVTKGYNPPAYGQIGVPSSSRLGSRFAGSAWSSVTGGRAVHWIFGGWSLDGNGTQGYTNDMWSYTSA